MSDWMPIPDCYCDAVEIELNVLCPEDGPRLMRTHFPGVAEGGARHPGTGIMARSGIGSRGSPMGRSGGVRAPLTVSQRSRPTPHPTPSNGSHQGTRVPHSRCHNAMNSNGDGGPARTRTWDQGIMSNRISSLLLRKGEES